MMQIATFSMNCFWEPQYFFSKLPGVVNTTVGYAGGTTKNPTYTDLGGHTETLNIEFDPEQISYKELLGHFFKQHDPTYDQKTQYKSIVFYHSGEQKQLAEESLHAFEQESGNKALTEIREAGKFYPAEEYHQHYVAKSRGEL